MKGLLVELEGGLRIASKPEELFVSGTDGLDVDHILPQSWSSYWPLADQTIAAPEEIAEVDIVERSGLTLNERQQAIFSRQAAVRTLGNLTLLNLSVNRQAQNHAFPEKRDLLIKNTVLLLNTPQIPLDTWNEQSIALRGRDLAEVAIRVWPGPSSPWRNRVVLQDASRTEGGCEKVVESVRAV
jgi:hypothetical protein